MALKAFIGHSFITADEDVVRPFLKFFEQIKEMEIGFSWEHAEAAESKDLANKVLGLMQDKNLFIGICTKNEEAINSKELKPTFFGGMLKASKDSFEPKTSDWIIQEIGLAIGKGMDLILLVENGLRKPGGLQGNMEYIAFERQSPEKAFGKVLEMIRSLIPKAKPVTKIEAEVRTAPEDKSEPPSQEMDWLKPQPDWMRDRFQLALSHSILLEDEDNEQTINQMYLATEEDQNKRTSWEAYHELARLRMGKGGHLTTLDQFAIDHPDNADVLRYRAQGYQRYGEQEKAAQYFEAAAEKTGSELEKLVMYGDAAVAFAIATRREEAYRIVEQMKSLASIADHREMSLLYTLKEIAKIEKSDDEFCCLTEKLLDLRPDDIDLRFELAYKYSDKGTEDLSLYHYLKIPHLERTPITWNNLGVQFDRFKLASKSVDAYRESEKHEETLAMSNLAYKFINAGFLKEAEEICNRALKTKDYHNVASAISRIRDLPDEEGKEIKEIQKKAAPLSEFFKNYGNALTKPTIGEHQSRWHGDECELNITIKDNIFKAEGSYERSSYSGLAAMLTGLPKGPDKKTKYLVRYAGSIQGKAVKATYTKASEDDPPKPLSLLGLGVDLSKPVLMIFSDSLEEIQVYEKVEKGGTKFYKFTRLS
jgi:tetratricopeptide (TPR) repeat protein